MCNMTEVKLREHSDSKHPKNSFADCFPTFVSLGGERGGQCVACSLLVTTWSACCMAEDGDHQCTASAPLLLTLSCAALLMPQGK